eukprot:930010-Pelagomonas_calceolata.AAC.1
MHRMREAGTETGRSSADAKQGECRRRAHRCKDDRTHKCTAALAAGRAKSKQGESEQRGALQGKHDGLQEVSCGTQLTQQQHAGKVLSSKLAPFTDAVGTLGRWAH